MTAGGSAGGCVLSEIAWRPHLAPYQGGAPSCPCLAVVKRPVFLWLLVVSVNLQTFSLISFHFSGSLRAIALFPSIPQDSLWAQDCPLRSVPNCTALVGLVLCLMSSKESEVCFKLTLGQTLSFRKNKAEWVFIY